MFVLPTIFDTEKIILGAADRTFCANRLKIEKIVNRSINLYALILAIIFFFDKVLFLCLSCSTNGLPLMFSSLTMPHWPSFQKNYKNMALHTGL